MGGGGGTRKRRCHRHILEIDKQGGGGFGYADDWRRMHVGECMFRQMADWRRMAADVAADVVADVAFVADMASGLFRTCRRIGGE